MKSREKSVGFWSMLGGLKKRDDGAGIEKPRPVRFWAEAHLSTQFPKEEKHRTETIVLVEYTGEREREREIDGLLLLLVTDHGSGHWLFPGASSSEMWRSGIKCKLE